MKKQSNYHFSYSIPIKKTKEKVWEALIDVENWKNWDTELLEASLDGTFKLGATGVLIPKKGPKLKFYISEIIPFKTYTFKTKMLLGSLDIKRTIIAENKTIIFEDDIQFTGILKHVFGFILGAGFIKVLPQVIENFKRIAESK